MIFEKHGMAWTNLFVLEKLFQYKQAHFECGNKQNTLQIFISEVNTRFMIYNRIFKESNILLMSQFSPNFLCEMKP